MNDLSVRVLRSDEEPPMNLLLLADPCESIVNRYITRGQSYIAKLKNEIVGIYVLLPTRPETVELVNIAVKEVYHGKGIGKKLVYHAMKTARSQGYKTMEIGTGNSSIDKLALYQKCGFRIIGVDIDFFTRHYSIKIIEHGIHCRDMIRLSQDL